MKEYRDLDLQHRIDNATQPNLEVFILDYVPSTRATREEPSEPSVCSCELFVNGTKVNTWVELQTALEAHYRGLIGY